MLVKNDSSLLGDKVLDPKENLKKLQEENDATTELRKLPDQTLLKNQDMARGKRMPYTELIYKLMKANPGLVIAEGGVAGAIQVRKPYMNANGVVETEYITGFFKDESMDEYSYVTCDALDLPTRESRGWREVVKQCIRVGAFSYDKSVEIFGEALGQRSQRFHEQLRDKK